MLHGYVRAGKRKAGVAQTTHVSTITDQSQALSKPSQKLVAITKIISQQRLTLVSEILRSHQARQEHA